METGTLVTLALYFVLMICIGLFAWRQSTDTSEGYLLAGRNLPPSVAALSAGASDMSGWLLLGLPGALYASGLVEAWIGIGLFVGAVVNWIVVAPRLRQQMADLIAQIDADLATAERREQQLRRLLGQTAQ